MSKLWIKIIIILIFFLPILHSSSQYSESPFDYWQLKAISYTPEIHNLEPKNEIAIIVIDTGIDFSHYDLGENLKWKNPVETSGIPLYDDDNNGYVDDFYGWDFVENDNNPAPTKLNIDSNENGIEDEYISHGTGIAGILAGQGEDMIGISPNVKIIDLKVYDSDGTSSNILESWNYTLKLAKLYSNIKVVNFSTTLSYNSSEINDIIDELIHVYDVSVVVSAGNNYNNGMYNVSYPGTQPDVISVGSVDENLEISSFSQRGPNLDLVAPGENVFSLAFNNQIDNNFDGTSYSAPFVSGAIAFLYSLSESVIGYKLNHSSIYDLLTTSTTDLGESGRDDVYGFGLLNMTKLIKQINLQENTVAFPSIFDLVFLCMMIKLIRISIKKGKTDFN